MPSKPLPPGWTEMTFSEMASQISERVDDPQKAGVDIYVGLEHLDPGDLRIRRRGTPGDVEATKLRVRPGQIIFGKRRAYQRKVAVADFDGIVSAHAMILQEKPSLFPGFLPFFMQSDVFMDRAVTISEGGLSPTIKWKTLAAEKFLIPPPQQQRELVELMQGFEAAVEASSKSVQAAQEFGIVLGEHLLSNKAEETVQLDKVAEVIGGKQLSPVHITGENMRPYLRAANIRPGWIDFSDVNAMNFDPREQERLTLKPGDTLLMEGNANPSYVGTPALYDNSMPKDHCIQNTVIRLRSLDSKKLMPSYLYVVMQHQFQSGKFKELASGSSIKHLGSTRLAKIKVHVPSIERQQMVIDKLLQSVDAHQAYQNEHESLRHLRFSVLNIALTPSDSAEEPALAKVTA